jgi:hypothetical protein
VARPVRPPPALATLDPERLAPTELAATLRFAEAAKAANTNRAYAADWADFCRWAAARRAVPLPCPPGLLCGYLAALADAGCTAATITTAPPGLDPPTANPAVREVLGRIRHARGRGRAASSPVGRPPLSQPLHS